MQAMILMPITLHVEFVNSTSVWAVFEQIELIK
jgi:hypothetical protein